jgi:hypothetical protein
MMCRCFDIFTPAEQKILKKYRKENFADKTLIYKERRAIGKCPLTPEEVIFCLNAHAFVCQLVINSTSIELTTTYEELILL